MRQIRISDPRPQAHSGFWTCENTEKWNSDWGPTACLFFLDIMNHQARFRSRWTPPPLRLSRPPSQSPSPPCYCYCIQCCGSCRKILPHARDLHGGRTGFCDGSRGSRRSSAGRAVATAAAASAAVAAAVLAQRQCCRPTAVAAAVPRLRPRHWPAPAANAALGCCRGRRRATAAATTAATAAVVCNTSQPGSQPGSQPASPTPASHQFTSRTFHFLNPRDRRDAGLGWSWHGPARLRGRFAQFLMSRNVNFPDCLAWDCE
jgi:hypothetical protein